MLQHLKTNKKAVAVRYLVLLIMGLIVFVFALWIMFKTQTENKTILSLIKGFF